MKNTNQNYETYENLTTSERAARVVVSTLAIVVAMQSSIAGSTLFAVICLLGIALAFTGLIGWDPVRAMSARKRQEKAHGIPHHRDSNGHHA